jgi:hypothetical protein
MSFQLGTPNTATALAALDPNSVRILWQKTIDMFDQAEDFFAQFEGEDKDSPVMVINDTSVKKGLKFRVTVRAGYYGPGKSGDSLFNNSADFEVDNITSYEIDADFLRNATSATQRADEYMGMMGELIDGQAAELGKWMGREKSARLAMTLVLKGGTPNLLYTRGVQNQDLLKTADGFTYQDVLMMGQALKPLGGQPAKVYTVNGVNIMKYLVVGVTAGLFTLKQDPVYQLMMQNAQSREKPDTNPLFQGGYAELDGHSIREYSPVDHDGYGPVGSWFSPKAFTSTAITPGTAAFNITGGGNLPNAASLTNIQYFRYFPNFAFEFLPLDVFVPGSNPVYVLIVNSRSDSVAPGKIGFYRYTTGNNGNLITIDQRLSPVQNGPIALAAVGNVTYNTGVWANLHTQNHDIGSTVILANSYGVPIGDTVMMGARTVIRGYGSMKNQRSTWDVDGGFEQRKYITSVFGQSLRKNVRGVFPGYVRMRHALQYPELGLPVVT